MRKRKILFCVSDGLGNQIQTIPSFLLCQKKHPDCDIYVCNLLSTSAEATKLLFGHIAAGIFFIERDRIIKKDYWGQYLMFPMMARVPGVRMINEFVLRPRLMKNINEVRCNLAAIKKNLDFRKTEYEPFVYDECWKVLRHIPQRENTPDVLVHNGYNKTSGKAERRWKVKSYPKYPQLVERLKNAGYSVGSIGSAGEYVPGTINMTGMKLTDTTSAIKGTKLLIANDTGTYHLANLVRKKNIALFTCTSNTKNYCPAFHKYTTLIRRLDLPCSPCQGGNREEFFWMKNVEQCKWQCREISLKQIFKTAVKLLRETP